MKKSQPKSQPRGKVHLIGYDAGGRILIDEMMSVEDYYGESHSLIDNAEFRSKQGVRHVQGKVYNYDGVLDQAFDVYYNASGAYLKRKVVHSDGTVFED